MLKYMDDLKRINPLIEKANERYFNKVAEINKSKTTITEYSAEIALLSNNTKTLGLDTRSQRVSRCTEVSKLKLQAQELLTYQECTELPTLHERREEYKEQYTIAHDTLINSIQDWLDIKTRYYVEHQLPFKQEDNQQLIQYVKDLKAIDNQILRKNQQEVNFMQRKNQIEKTLRKLYRWLKRVGNLKC